MRNIPVSLLSPHQIRKNPIIPSVRRPARPPIRWFGWVKTRTLDLRCGSRRRILWTNMRTGLGVDQFFLIVMRGNLLAMN
ncbi:hypothetical protein BDV36DRAFT_257285 [Aspergillus pseudocaelatus]|uniref:Uncharacterized protein n=1 Tax=Aspergillus pseudocaelatus TaxID=1825620 RepID=A0ABQ6WJP8_9EURO|nr:hypothetical protein BDV36DRAFT_257285 [Aspergillus pseudocaelatus]